MAGLEGLEGLQDFSAGIGKFRKSDNVEKHTTKTEWFARMQTPPLSDEKRLSGWLEEFHRANNEETRANMPPDAMQTDAGLGDLQAQSAERNTILDINRRFEEAIRKKREEEMMRELGDEWRR